MATAGLCVGRAGLAAAEEVSLVITDGNWLPYESLADKLLLVTAIGARPPVHEFPALQPCPRQGKNCRLSQRERFAKSGGYHLGRHVPRRCKPPTKTHAHNASSERRGTEGSHVRALPPRHGIHTPSRSKWCIRSTRG